MKKLLKKMAAAIARMVKAFGRGVMGGGSGGAPGQAPVEVPTVEAEDGDDLDEVPEQTVSNTLKPSYENVALAKQVQNYNLAFEAMDYNTRSDIRAKLEATPKGNVVHQWVSRLSDNDRAICMNCSADQIANHISGAVPIDGVAAVGMAATYDTRPVPYGKKITQELVATAPKPEGNVHDLDSYRKQANERTQDIGSGKPLTKYEQRMAEQMERQNTFADQKQEALMSSGGPKPPKSMMH